MYMSTHIFIQLLRGNNVSQIDHLFNNEKAIIFIKSLFTSTLTYGLSRLTPAIKTFNQNSVMILTNYLINY